MLLTEYRNWVAKWNEFDYEVPGKLIDVFKACDPVTYSNMYVQ